MTTEITEDAIAAALAAHFAPAQIARLAALRARPIDLVDAISKAVSNAEPCFAATGLTTKGEARGALLGAWGAEGQPDEAFYDWPGTMDAGSIDINGARDIHAALGHALAAYDAR